MIDFLVEVFRKGRADRGWKPHEAATFVRVDPSTIYRWESRKWPRNPDDAVREYSKIMGVPPIEIWKAAIRAWEEDLAAQAEGGELTPEPGLPDLDSDEPGDEGRPEAGRG